MGLARTMTLKASAAGLNLGGGKAVMIDDGRTEMREARLEAAARVIEDSAAPTSRRRTSAPPPATWITWPASRAS